VNELRILGKVYRVDRTPNHIGPGGAQVYGTCDHGRSVIVLDSGQDTQQERDTLMHEAVHALDFAMCLELEERQVHALGAGLSALFADNPALAFYLSGHQVEIVEESPARKAKKNATRRTR
jgi:hypothetical protein